MPTRTPTKTLDHLARALHPTPKMIKAAMADVNGFNAKVAVFITRLVGTMWAAYVFTVIALIGLPAALRPSGEGIIAWIAQTFLQLVLLSVIMVGQNVQSLAADARADNTFKDTEVIIDRLDLHTADGLGAVMSRIDEISLRLGELTKQIELIKAPGVMAKDDAGGKTNTDLTTK